VYPFPVLPLFAIENCVFVLGQHLLLSRHGGLPPLHSMCLDSLFREGIVYDVDDFVDMTEAAALAGFLVSREAPRDLPVCLVSLALSQWRGGWDVPEQTSGEGRRESEWAEHCGRLML
jgi:hypothetical protein